jgi:flagellar basal body-associated protein FliL
MAGATVAEKLFGSDFALLNIYNSWWFVVLWGLLAVFSVNSIFLKNGISKNRILKNKISILLIHIAFLVILAGALVTFLTAKRGSMHIRQGEIHNYYIDEKTQTRQPLPFDLKLLLFEIEYHENSDKPSNFHSYLMINNEVCEVAMNKIHSQNHYRLYQMEYDNDEMGSTLLVNYDFWGISITYFGYLLLLISALWLLWQKRITIKRNTFLKRVTFGGSILPIVAVPTALVWIFISQIKPMTPILRSPMLAAHVSVIMVSYFLLLLIAVLSIIALLQKKKEQEQKLYAQNKT